MPSIDYDLMPSAKDVDNINADLIGLKKEFGNQELDFSLKKITYSAEMIVDALKEQKKPDTKKDIKTFVTDFIDRFCDDSKGIKNHRTILVYLTTKRYIKEFEAENKIRVTFEKID